MASHSALSLLPRLLLPCVLACTTLPLSAQLADPTRPPAVVVAAASAPVPAASAPVPAAAPRLQSVQLPREGAPSALIDDRLVRLGDKLGERTVVAIDAAGLLLRHPKGATERLPLLHPAIVKQARALPPVPPALAGLPNSRQP